jgi:DNA-binding transcriptional regulator YiaG
LILMSITYHSKICEIAHGAMAELFAAGLIDMDRMTEFDRLCVNDHPTPDSLPAVAPPPAAPKPLRVEQASVPTVALQPQPARTIKLNLSNAFPSKTPAPPPQQAPSNAAPELQSAAALRALRIREGVNVAAFAHYLEVQPQAVVAWEAGFLRPSPPVARLLEVVAEKGLAAIR